MIKNLKLLRTSRGISQQQLASVLNVSQQSVNKYENHNVEPDISILIAMADYFDTTIDYLVGKSSCDTSEYILSEHEEKLILKYRKLASAEKKCILTMIDVFSESQK